MKYIKIVTFKENSGNRPRLSLLQRAANDRKIASGQNGKERNEPVSLARGQGYSRPWGGMLVTFDIVKYSVSEGGLQCRE